MDLDAPITLECAEQPLSYWAKRIPWIVDKHCHALSWSMSRIAQKGSTIIVGFKLEQITTKLNYDRVNNKQFADVVDRRTYYLSNEDMLTYLEQNPDGGTQTAFEWFVVTKNTQRQDPYTRLTVNVGNIII